MKARILLQTLFISFLLCFFTKAQEAESPADQNTLNAPKTFSIPFGPSMHHPFSFYFDVGEPTRAINAAIDMRSSGLWVNNYTDRNWPGIKFRCDLSQTCKSQRYIQDFAWIEGSELEKRNNPVAGTLVKEKVNLGVTLPSTDALIVNSPSTYEIVYFREGSLGLNFRRSNPEIPTFFESIKTAGLVDKSIFSMFFDLGYGGELFFGGYDPKRAESEFQYAQWQEDEDPTLPGFSLQAKGVGYGGAVFAEKYTVVIDMEYASIMIPEWVINKIDQEESSRGLSDEVQTCKSIPFLQDIVIEFEGMTIRIPPAAYMEYKDVYTYDKSSKGCYRSLVKTDESKPRIILGAPFLRFFYTVFNLEEKTVGFSKTVSLEKRYPFEKGARDPEARDESEADYPSEIYYDPEITGDPYYLPLKVGGALAVLLIAKFCVMLYFIIRAWKRPQTSAEDLASPKIEIGDSESPAADNGNQDSRNIDVGKITREEEKFYA